MPWRVSYFFGCEPQPGAGWSESFWNNLTDLSAVVTAAGKLATLLDRVHAKEVFTDYARISEVGSFRRIKIEDYGNINNQAVAADDTDYPTNALLLDLVGVAGSPAKEFHVRQWFRGIPDRQIVKSVYTPIGNHATGVANIRAHLLDAANGWCLRVTNRAHEYKAVGAVSVTGEVRIPNHGFTTGQLVRMSKISPRVGVNKVWKITVLTTDTFQLDRFQTQPTSWIYDGTGQAKRIEYLYPAISQFQVLRATKRNVGKPSRLFTGRAKRPNR